jgi:hypothetical protein
MELIPKIEEEISKIQPLEIETQTKLVETEVRIAKPKVCT